MIDWQSPSIIGLAQQLSSDSNCRNDFVRRAFEWVRDEVRHTGDHQIDSVTCSASDVLAQQTGYCYGKSHLLVALCRANGIRAGFGYQRLSIDGEGAPFCLHGFAIVELEEWGWRRIDPRGNKPGLKLEFSASQDQLAFAPCLPGEATSPEIYPEPLPVVVEALSRFTCRSDFSLHLPDWPPIAEVGSA